MKGYLFKSRVRTKHTIALWLFSIFGFVTVLALGTKFFTATVQDTRFGSSDYFIISMLGFIFLGFVSFCLTALLILLNIIRSNWFKSVVKSPIFIVLIFIFILTIGISSQKIIPVFRKQIENNQIVQNTLKERQPNISPDVIFELTNNERIKNGLKPLKRDPKLDEAALERAIVIIEFNEWAHEATKSGVPYTEAVKQAHYWNINYGENLANGQFTSEEVVNGWMNSEGHKENILSSKFQDVGIATYSGELNGFSTVVTAQLFGGYQPPNYTKEYINNWENSLNGLINIKPSWENIKNFPSTYEANKQDADRMIEIINIRINRMQKIISRIKANRWFTAEENRWTYEDEKLFNEQENLATSLNNLQWR